MIVNINSSTIFVILVNYNGLNDTISCLNSLKHMEGCVSVIVVDNASDKTEWLDLKDLFPKIHVIHSDINLGFSGGNNLGIQYAIESGAEYIILLNNDTVVNHSFLSQLLQAVETDCILVPKMMYFNNPDIIWYGGGYFNKFSGRAIHRNMNCKDTMDQTPSQYCTFATGCCMFIPVSIIQTIGLLDETYFMYCEDCEYCLRILKNRKRIKYVPSAVLWHKVSQSTGGDESSFSIYYMTRNRFYYLKKYKSYFYLTAIPFTYISR